MLIENSHGLWTKHSCKVELALTYHIAAKQKRHWRAIWNSGTQGRLQYGNRNRRASLERKCEVDHPHRSTRVNPTKKQKCCSPPCLWSQVEVSLPDLGDCQSRVINREYVVDVPVCELRCCFLLVENRDSVNSAFYVYRKMSARNGGTRFVYNRMPSICWKPLPQKPRNVVN